MAANPVYFYIPVNPAQIPVQITFDIGGPTSYFFVFFYNAYGDFFTLYIYDLNQNLLYTTKLNYGVRAIHAVIEALVYANNLIPYSESEISGGTNPPKAFNAATFGNGAQIYVANAP